MRPIGVLLTASAVLLLIVGCGGSSAPTPTQPEQAEPVSQAELRAISEVITLSHRDEGEEIQRTLNEAMAAEGDPLRIVRTGIAQRAICREAEPRLIRCNVTMSSVMNDPFGQVDGPGPDLHFTTTYYEVALDEDGCYEASTVAHGDPGDLYEDLYKLEGGERRRFSGCLEGSASEPDPNPPAATAGSPSEPPSTSEPALDGSIGQMRGRLSSQGWWTGTGVQRSPSGATQTVDVYLIFREQPGPLVGTLHEIITDNGTVDRCAGRVAETKISADTVSLGYVESKDPDNCIASTKSRITLRRNRLRFHEQYELPGGGQGSVDATLRPGPPPPED